MTLPPAKSDGALRYGLWRAFGRNPRFHREAGLGFEPGFFNLAPGTYLHGYWQSERYFAPIATQLRDDLVMTSPLTGANADMAARIKAAKLPVSVHVRRGDYLATGRYAACTSAYYRQAIERLESDLGHPPRALSFRTTPLGRAPILTLGRIRPSWISMTKRGGISILP